jgi:cathepsin B
LYQAKANSATNPTSIADIQTAIMTTGPVQAAFSVYQDFFSYKSGVYVHTSGSLDGGHAIVLVGWTVVNGMDAWIVRNSWGTGWGLSGYFMIQRGVDMCGIESQVWYGNASV